MQQKYVEVRPRVHRPRVEEQLSARLDKLPAQLVIYMYHTPFHNTIPVQNTRYTRSGTSNAPIHLQHFRAFHFRYLTAAPPPCSCPFTQRLCNRNRDIYQHNLPYTLSPHSAHCCCYF